MDQQPGIGAGVQAFQQIIQGCAQVQADDPPPWHHELAHPMPPELQRLAQPFALPVLQQSAVAALADQQIDLLGRMDMAMAGFGADAQTPQNQRAAAVEQPDEGGKQRQ